MVWDAERDLAACRELARITIVSLDGCDVFHLHGWDEDFGGRKLRQDSDMHYVDEFALVKTPSPRWLQWFASL